MRQALSDTDMACAVPNCHRSASHCNVIGESLDEAA